MEPVTITNESLLQSVHEHLACAGQHLGLWAIEPRWFARAVNAVNAGTWPLLSEVQIKAQAEDRRYAQIGDNIALIRIVGQMQKGSSKFGGTSTIRVRRALRQALAKPDVKGIMLSIDTPGGTAAGTLELADDVAAAQARKPVHAYIEDLGASAAYWVASQAGRLSANRPGEIGSIGTFGVIEDLTDAAEQMGIKVHLISTGPYKGMGYPGTPVTEEHLAYVQELVEDINETFLQSVKRGRGVPIATVHKWADGRTWVGKKALDKGMIDAVEPFDEAVKALRRAVAERRSGTAGRRTTTGYAIRIAQMQTA